MDRAEEMSIKIEGLCIRLSPGICFNILCWNCFYLVVDQDQPALHLKQKKIMPKVVVTICHIQTKE